MADQLFVDPQAEFILRGPSSSPLYYAGALKKFGVGVQVFRVGKYKSFVEPYIRENMSPENREQLEKLFGDIWSEVTTTIEQARGLPSGSFEQLINENGLIDGELAVKSKLGTELVSLSDGDGPAEDAVRIRSTAPYISAGDSFFLSELSWTKSQRAGLIRDQKLPSSTLKGRSSMGKDRRPTWAANGMRERFESFASIRV